jgi:hypothetical protein
LYSLWKWRKQNWDVGEELKKFSVLGP